jgi:hypothetical protein
MRLLRTFAAILITLAGAALITALWFRELTETAVIDAVLGAIYLIIGIGLFGRSRFTLFVALVVPALDAAWLLHRTPAASLDAVQAARLSLDLLVVLSAALVLALRLARRR